MTNIISRLTPLEVRCPGRLPVRQRRAGLLTGLIINLLVGFIRFYQIVFSPLHMPVCRFQPTCSEYFIQALKQKGLLKGTCYGIRRVLRCHPFGRSGYDPVPE